MHIPKINLETDESKIFSFIQKFSFGTIITANESKPLATHLPFLVQKIGGKIILSSHFNRANNQWRVIENNEVLVIFNEPHAYISPSNYDSTVNVPTWNYIAVHAYGKGVIRDDKAIEILEQTILQYEPAYKKQWDTLPAEYKSNMIKGIVPFEIEVMDLQANKKLSQNRSSIEKQRIIENLSKSNNSAERGIAYYMKNLLLLFVLTCCIFCNGQPYANSNTIRSEKLSIKSGHPKLVRTLSKSEYEVVYCGLQDKNGNIWFGTTSEGVYKYDGKIFTQYTIQDGLVSNCIFSILEDKNGNIWLGTSNGICLFKDNKISSIPINSFVRHFIIDKSYYSNFSNTNTVWSMMQDKTGKLWFGTGDGVYIYNGIHFTRFLANDNIINKAGLTLKLVSGMLEDKKGNMWFASGMPPGYEGLSRFDGKIIENFKPKNEGWYRTILERKNGDLLLATRHFGVWNYDGNTFTDYIQPKELVKTSLNAILEDKAENLWVASDYGKDLGDTLGGLWHSTNPKDKSFTKISNKEVCFILEDKENNIWFGTRNMGLYSF